MARITCGMLLLLLCSALFAADCATGTAPGGELDLSADPFCFSDFVIENPQYDEVSPLETQELRFDVLNRGTADAVLSVYSSSEWTENNVVERIIVPGFQPLPTSLTELVDKSFVKLAKAVADPDVLHSEITQIVVRIPSGGGFALSKSGDWIISHHLAKWGIHLVEVAGGSVAHMTDDLMSALVASIATTLVPDYLEALRSEPVLSVELARDTAKVVIAVAKVVSDPKFISKAAISTALKSVIMDANLVYKSWDIALVTAQLVTDWAELADLYVANVNDPSSSTVTYQREQPSEVIARIEPEHMRPLIGVWVGSGRDADGRFTLRVDVNVDTGEYLFAFPSDDCGGRLTPVSVDETSGALLFREELTYGQENCTAHEEVTIMSPPWGGPMFYSWLDPLEPVELGHTIKRGATLFHQVEPERVEVLPVPTVTQTPDYIAAQCDGRDMPLSACEQLLRDSQRIAAGVAHSLAVKADGTVVSWGSNKTGQLGDGTLKSRSFALPVVDESGKPLGDIVAVAAGSTHSLALTRGGEVLAWGANLHGQLGDYTKKTRLHPTPVGLIDAGGARLADVVSIATVGRRSFALTKHGALYHWGKKATRYPTAVKDAAGNDLSAIVAIAAGTKDILMLKADGTLLAWRDLSKRKPRWPEVVLGADDQPLQGMVAIAAGSRMKLALHNDGTVFAWDGDYREKRNTPSPLVLRVGRKRTPPGPALAVAAKSRNNYVLLDDATLISVPWAQYPGRKFTLAKPFEHSPPTGVAAVAPGARHNVLLGKDGRLYAWGSNDNGELGTGTVGAQPGLKLVVERSGLPLQLD